MSMTATPAPEVNGADQLEELGKWGAGTKIEGVEALLEKEPGKKDLLHLVPCAEVTISECAESAGAD